MKTNGTEISPFCDKLNATPLETGGAGACIRYDSATGTGVTLTMTLSASRASVRRSSRAFAWHVRLVALQIEHRHPRLQAQASKQHDQYRQNHHHRESIAVPTELQYLSMTQTQANQWHETVATVRNLQITSM